MKWDSELVIVLIEYELINCIRRHSLIKYPVYDKSLAESKDAAKFATGSAYATAQETAWLEIYTLVF